MVYLNCELYMNMLNDSFTLLKYLIFVCYWFVYALGFVRK